MWLLKNLKNTLLSQFKKNIHAMTNFHLKKPLTKSSVMKIGCKIPKYFYHFSIN
jgi:hypothetical protein